MALHNNHSVSCVHLSIQRVLTVGADAVTHGRAPFAHQEPAIAARLFLWLLRFRWGLQGSELAPCAGHDFACASASDVAWPASASSHVE